MLILVILLVFTALSGGLVWYFLHNDRGNPEPIGMLWTAGFLGVAGAAAASVLEKLAIPSAHLHIETSSLGGVFSAAVIVGVIEEVCKFLPLAVVLYKRSFFNEHTDGIIYFAVAGVGFGLPENILYTLQFGAQAGIARVIMTPFFHAAITAAVGYVLINVKLHHKSLLLAAAALALAMFGHGFYDFGLLSQRPVYAVASFIFTITVSIGMFLLYARATLQDQSMGLSAVGHNSFCRSCGKANPRHFLHCTRCGKYA